MKYFLNENFAYSPNYINSDVNGREFWNKKFYYFTKSTNIFTIEFGNINSFEYMFKGLTSITEIRFYSFSSA